MSKTYKSDAFADVHETVCFAVGTLITLELNLGFLGMFPADEKYFSYMLFGLIISGGTVGTNSVIKYLQATKELKQQAAGMEAPLITGS